MNEATGTLEREIVVEAPACNPEQQAKIGYGALCASCPLVDMLGGCPVQIRTENSAPEAEEITEEAEPFAIPEYRALFDDESVEMVVAAPIVAQPPRIVAGEVAQAPPVVEEEIEPTAEVTLPPDPVIKETAPSKPAVPIEDKEPISYEELIEPVPQPVRPPKSPEPIVQLDALHVPEPEAEALPEPIIEPAPDSQIGPVLEPEPETAAEPKPASESPPVLASPVPDKATIDIVSAEVEIEPPVSIAEQKPDETIVVTEETIELSKEEASEAVEVTELIETLIQEAESEASQRYTNTIPLRGAETEDAPVSLTDIFEIPFPEIITTYRTGPLLSTALARDILRTLGLYGIRGIYLKRR